MAVQVGPTNYNVPYSGPRLRVNDSAAIASGMAFLEGELEKQDKRLLEPMTSVTWQRDIVPMTGGGWSDFSSNVYVDYATTGGNENGITGGETNDIPTMQANMSKDIFDVYNFQTNLRVPFIDQQKMQRIARSLPDIFDKGIRLNWNKTLDLVIYTGVTSANKPGLINNPNATAVTAAKGASGYTTWTTKTADEILADINNLINDTWANSQYDLTGMANHILIPPANFSYITSQVVSSAGNVSILRYLLENNIAQSQGVDLVIVPSRWCIGAGTAGTDRMAGYVNLDDRVNFDMTVPLTRIGTEMSVQQAAYLTGYAGQFSQVKFLFNECVEYVDGI